MVIFIDLHRLFFSDKETALKVVEAYIQHNFPWFLDEECCGKRLLILDGLDEIAKISGASKLKIEDIVEEL